MCECTVATEPSNLVDATSTERIHAELRAYANNPAFRSAEGSELLFSDNPFHRPVRPNDLDFVQFSRPLLRDNCSELSALMGQRLLLNVYDADYPFVGDEPLSAQAMGDKTSFYADQSRLRAEVVRPFLERHLFSWIETKDEKPDWSLDQILDDQLRKGLESAAKSLNAVNESTEPARMGKLLAIQITGAAYSKELAISRWSCVDWHGQTAEFIASCSQLARKTQRDLMALSSGCGLVGGPHTYWQFYLGTWIGISNYLHLCTRNPLRFYEALGAVLFDRLRLAGISACWQETLAGSLGKSLPLDLLEHCSGRQSERLRAQGLDVLTNGAAVHGERVLRAAARGIVGAQRLWCAADQDFEAQCVWASKVDHYRVVAQRYMELIGKANRNIALETYDEESSERSTTHVHDTDRLLVIESGEMDFWHSFGAPVHFIPGDMIYVPRHRLHGSVVTTDRCVYHQPIIDQSLAGAYEETWTSHSPQ